ncbi:MAG: hypothetical protein IJ779_05725 [Ruminococcus sp.]|nr:hypothetical protein [Ruminococcus sp.]
MVSGCLAKVVFSDVRRNFLLHYLIALGIILITPMIFGTAQLSEKMAAQPLEIMSSLMGGVLLVPIFSPEQNASIRDVVRSKKTSYRLVCFIRIFCSLVVLVILISALTMYMRYSDSEVTFRLYFGAFASGAALGSLGLLSSAVSDNYIIGYMVGASYFLMNLFLKDKLGRFNLFAMSEGVMDGKGWLVITAALLICICFTIRKELYEK